MCKEISIWDRKLKMKIDLDCLDDEVATELQKETLSSFIDNFKILDDALPYVKDYCLAEKEMRDNDFKSDIFSYVIPKTIFVPREDKKKTVAILCDYYFDKEHGLAIVFENQKFKKIAPQDEII